MKNWFKNIFKCMHYLTENLFLFQVQLLPNMDFSKCKCTFATKRIAEIL